jgi:general secretion pathway protein F
LLFNYEALGSDRQQVSGTVDALNEREALRQLEEKKLLVLTLKPPSQPIRLLQKKLTRTEICVSLFELTELMQAGVTIAESVDSLCKSDQHPDLLAFYKHIAVRLQQGSGFGAAVSSSKLELPVYLLQLIEAGELSGDLAASLSRGVAQLEYDLRVANELRNALIYPAILVFSGFSAVALMFIFVVPKFANLLKGNHDLPFLASVVLNTGMWLNTNVWLFLAVIVLIAIAVMALLSRTAVRQGLLDRLGGVPVIGLWLTELDIARWSSVMAAMLSSRVGLIQSLLLAQKSIKSNARRRGMEIAGRAVQAGGSLSGALSDQDVLSPTAYNLIRAGEQSGRLAEMMAAVAKIYDNNSRNAMKKALLIIEPLAIVIIGILIATIMIGVVQAITSVNDIEI